MFNKLLKIEIFSESLTSLYRTGAGRATFTIVKAETLIYYFRQNFYIKASVATAYLVDIKVDLYKSRYI